MSQKVTTFHLKDLRLWTENPRDVIDARASDQTIVDRAIADQRGKWTLPKLAQEMGEYYDFSELPTVVLHGQTPIVYDGNRRIILGKIKHGHVKADGIDVAAIPDFPEKIPCNLCSRDIALANIFRKHADTGSWQPLERDIFLHKFMGKPKTPFLMMEENTGLISKNPHLNQRFVKEEIFRPDTLEELGIFLEDGKLLSKFDPKETREILEDISEKIKNRTISTRKNRGDVLGVLNPDNRRVIDSGKRKSAKEVDLKNVTESSPPSNNGLRQTRRVRGKGHEIFGGPLYLNAGDVSNLYRDIADLHRYYRENKKGLSAMFPCLIRMALRLLAETAAKDKGKDLKAYVSSHFQAAKSTLDTDAKTTLSNHNVNEGSLVQLLHTGAHNYSAAAGVDQTIAVSVIIGAILTDSHGKAAKS